MCNLKKSLKSRIYFILIVSGIFFLTPFVCEAGEGALGMKVHATFLSMDFFGNINGAGIGDIVTVTDPDGVTCGRFVVNKDGRYGFVHVYGDDPTTQEDEGAESDDILTFKLNREFLDGPEVYWIGDGKKERVDFSKR